MTKIWVGSIAATIILILTTLGTAVSAPTEDRSETFEDSPMLDKWQLIRGNASFQHKIGPANDVLTWLVLEDDDDFSGTGISRIRSNMSHVETDGEPYWNGTAAAYVYSATLERDLNYTAPASTAPVAPTPSTTKVQTFGGDLDATLDADVVGGYAPLTVTFDLTSTDANASSLAWSFDAESSGVEEANGTGLPATTSHTYGTPGIYTALLEVSNNTTTGFATIEIEVLEVPAEPLPTLEGMVGITFGETSGSGYYLAAFGEDRFLVGFRNDSTGAFDIVVNQTHWGNVLPVNQDIDDRHKYEVTVSGTTATFRVGNALVGTYGLPSAATGAFGVMAGEDTRVNIGEVHWAALDTTPPVIDLFRPAPGHLYIHDRVAVEYAVASPIFVTGPLTVFADVEDDTGVEWLELRVNGKVKGAVHEPTDDNGTAFPIDTSGLPAGYNTITVRAFDYSGNWAQESVQIYVLSTNVGGKAVGDGIHATGTAVSDVADKLPL